MTAEQGLKESLESLDAFIAGLEGDLESALERLSKSDSPVDIRRRFGLLVDAKRFDEVGKASLQYPLAKEWAFLAILALGATGAFARATEILRWARDLGTASIEFACVVALFDGSKRHIFRRRSEGSFLISSDFNSNELDELRQLDVAVTPSFERLKSSRIVITELEVQVLVRQLDLSFWLGDTEKGQAVCELLLTRVPIPLKLAETVLQGILVPKAEEIATRLVDEHPGEFRAKFLASVIRGRVLNQRDAAFDLASSISSLAHSDEEKRELCELLYEMSASGDRSRLSAVVEMTTAMLGASSELVTLFKVEMALKEGDIKAALNLLEADPKKDSVQWARMYATAILRSGDETKALEQFLVLGETFPDPEVFRVIARLAKKHNKPVEVLHALKRLISLEPKNVEARETLAAALIAQQEYGQAAKQFVELRQLARGDERTVVNLAVSYFYGGDINSALGVLLGVPLDEIGTVELLTTRAQMLLSANRAKDGFRDLMAHKNRFWNSSRYLLVLMNVSHASGEETMAHQAMMHLQELQQSGEVKEKVLHSASLEEITNWISASAKRTQMIAQMIREGKVPWVMAAEMRREVPYWAWMLKTQAMRWVGEDPDYRTWYCIYNTNGFRILNSDTGPSLREIECPRPQTPIAIDMSALITAHALGLLTKVAEYFGEVFVPAVYLKKSLEHSKDLLPHQISQKNAAEAIRSEILARRMQVLAKGQSAPYPSVDEYSDKSEAGVSVYRIRDVLAALHNGGVIDDAQLSEGMRVAHKPAAIEGGDGKLLLGARIVISELTLGTLHSTNLLSVVAREFGVFVSDEDAQGIEARIAAFDALGEAHRRHSELWETIRKDARFRIVPTVIGFVGNQEDADDDVKTLALAALNLAKERRLPLYADDRVCQAIVLNERRDDRGASFGSDKFLEALTRSSLISLAEAAKHCLQLMTWRYRFILPPAEYLRELADRYRAHPPGASLRSVARYVHDCMQDTGLFGGMEPTHPPTTIAIRIYQTWATNIAEFLTDVWTDSNSTEEFANQLTTWAINELLPSPPLVMNEAVQSRMAKLGAQTILSRALIRASSSDNVERVSKCLRSMANTLGLEENEYCEIVAGVVRERS